MKSLKEDKNVELGRVIAQEIRKEEVGHQKNMIKAERRKNTMLERAAEIALTGGVKVMRPKQ